MHQADTTMSFGFGALSGDPESFQRDAEQIRQFEEELRRRLEQEAKDEAAQAAARDATIAVFNVNPKLAGIRRWRYSSRQRHCGFARAWRGFSGQGRGQHPPNLYRGPDFDFQVFRGRCSHCKPASES